MHKKLAALILLSSTLLAGCTTAMRVTVAPDGTRTTSRLATVLTRATTFDDSVSAPSGVISTTRLSNYSTDTQAINALRDLAVSLLSKGAPLPAAVPSH